MRIQHRLGAGLLAVPLVVAGLAATPPEGCYAVVEDDPDTTADETVLACERPTWVADPTGTKAGNLAVSGGTEFPTLVDEEPTESVAGGGAVTGAGYLGTSLAQVVEPEPDATGFTMTGEFTGVVDTLAITLHGVHSGFGKAPFSPTGELPPENPNPAAPTERGPMTAYVSLEMDGLPVIPVQKLEVEFTTDAAPTAAASERYRANITNLYALMQDWDLDVGPDDVHTMTLRITPRFINTDPAVLFLYGTSEVPSGVVFNPLAPDPDVATVPGF